RCRHLREGGGPARAGDRQGGAGDRAFGGGVARRGGERGADGASLHRHRAAVDRRHPGARARRPAPRNRARRDADRRPPLHRRIPEDGHGAPPLRRPPGRVPGVLVTARKKATSPARQAVHTVYGGAHLFRSDSARKLGDLALRSLDAHAPEAKTFAAAVGLAPELAPTVYDRVREKLRREPVEDFRIDFEDGYGNRPDAEEDATARSAAGEVAAGMVSGALPPFIGIRIKPLSQDLSKRALRTLELFLGALLERTHGRLPANFIVTLPKIVVTEQVAALVTAFEALERRYKLARATLRLELMVETPQSTVDAAGRCRPGDFVDDARGRCVAAHFGVYDYTAALNITAAEQRMQHPACDHARQVMQVALAGT